MQSPAVRLLIELRDKDKRYEYADWRTEAAGQNWIELVSIADWLWWRNRGRVDFKVGVTEVSYV